MSYLKRNKTAYRVLIRNAIPLT